MIIITYATTMNGRTFLADPVTYPRSSFRDVKCLKAPPALPLPALLTPKVRKVCGEVEWSSHSVSRNNTRIARPT